MRIAIPVFNRRISPRFDCAGNFLFATIEKGEIVERLKLSSSQWTQRQRVEKLQELGVDILICGGIDKPSERLLRFCGIRVYIWVTGMAEDALRSFLRGELKPGTMVGAGGRSRGRWKFRRGTLQDH